MEQKQIKQYAQRLFSVRSRAIKEKPFFGTVASGLTLALDDSVETAATDGRRIIFAPKFMDELNDNELYFILLHEIMHICFKHVVRGKKYDHFIYNIAADIVINSHLKLMGVDISVNGEDSMHLAPNDCEGHNYSTEQIYFMLYPKKNEISKNASRYFVIDNHSGWDESLDADYDVKKLICDSWNSTKNVNNGKPFGDNESTLRNIIESYNKPKINWRQVLREFVQEDVLDYCFTPPDKRYDGYDFFLPDLSPNDVSIKDVLFMVDTSGSVSDKELRAVMSEIKGAIEQFEGRIKGYVGFFDTSVYGPYSFENVEDALKNDIQGWGGTSFYCIFKHIFDGGMKNLPSSIVILTDGYAAFPEESIARGIPVLWALTEDEDEYNTPPWGKIVHIDIED